MYTSPGLEFVGPGHYFIPYSTLEQTMKFSGGKKLVGRTSDGLEISVSFHFQYLLDTTQDSLLVNHKCHKTILRHVQQITRDPRRPPRKIPPAKKTTTAAITITITITTANAYANANANANATTATKNLRPSTKNLVTGHRRWSACSETYVGRRFA